jgi:hypothetical protein
MPSLFTNNALTTIQTSITAVSTSVTVNDASAFPLSVGQDYFYITMQDAIAGTHIEIAKVTNVTSNTFTIVRGQEGTTPYAFQAGDKVELRLTAFGIKEVRFPRVAYAASPSSPLTINSDLTDQYNITALATNITIANPTGTPVTGQKLIIRIKDNGTPRNISFGSAFAGVGTTLPTQTVANKLTYVGCLYNADAARWDVLAWIQEL